MAPPRVSATEAEAIWGRLVRGETTLTLERQRLGLRLTGPIRKALLLRVDRREYNLVVARAQTAVTKRRREARERAWQVTQPGQVHERPQDGDGVTMHVGPVVSVTLGESREALVQRIDRIVSIRLVRREHRTLQDSLRIVGTLMLPVEHIGPVCQALRRVGRRRARDPS